MSRQMYLDEESGQLFPVSDEPVREKKTNADHIRSMTGEELAVFFVKKMDYICKKKDRYCDGLHCVSCTIDWLREEYTE